MRLTTFHLATLLLAKMHLAKMPSATLQLVTLHLVKMPPVTFHLAKTHLARLRAVISITGRFFFRTLLCGCVVPLSSVAAEHSVLSGKTMGTTWSLIVADVISNEDMRELQVGIEVELFRINALMSTWNPQSELSLFNNDDSLKAVPLHKDTIKLVAAAHVISEKTDGAYDVTLGPIIALWGFGPDSVDGDTPDKIALQNAMQTTGYRKLERKQNALRKTVAGLQIDLSSIAKGFAVDQMATIVERYGISNYSAEIGGELLTRGKRSDGSDWRIGVVQPDGGEPVALRVSNSHIASSGDYQNYREVNGKRISHIINGISGRPITHGTVAVTVVHKSTMLADAWATALMVVNPERAWQLANEQELAVQISLKGSAPIVDSQWEGGIVTELGGFTIVRTASFDALLE